MTTDQRAAWREIAIQLAHAPIVRGRELDRYEPYLTIDEAVAAIAEAVALERERYKPVVDAAGEVVIATRLAWEKRKEGFRGDLYWQGQDSAIDSLEAAIRALGEGE